MTVTQKRQTFRELHQAGCFVLPNPWDVGTARYLQQAGFKALATTSAGFAFTQGKPDSYRMEVGALSLDESLAHFAQLASACDVPINADFEDGFGTDLTQLAVNVRRCAETGVAGLSIEDNAGARLYPFEESVARVGAAVAALAGSGVMLVARCEGTLLGCCDFGETLRRLQAFAQAGADCLYAPGLKTAEEVMAVVQACAPKPVNVLVSSPIFTVSQLSALGVRRISLGGALARAAWGGMMRAANEILQNGTFEQLTQAASWSEVNGFLEQDWQRRQAALTE